VTSQLELAESAMQCARCVAFPAKRTHLGSIIKNHFDTNTGQSKMALRL
jgi:hypothetical protein